MQITDNPGVVLNNGVSMPMVGLGVYQSSPAETAYAVAEALRVGYRLIDTAAVYGNEAEVGQGIRDSGVPRDEIFVTTKLWVNDFGHDEALRAFDASQEKLGLDIVDLYLLHWPVPAQFERTLASWKALERLLSEGRVRAIGVSNFEPEHLDRVVEAGSIVPAVNQVELHPFFAQGAVRAADARHAVVTQAWSPIGGIQRYSDGTGADPLLDRTIADIAQAHDRTPAQVMLRWELQHGISVIPKSVKPERIAENFDLFGFALSQQEMQAIDGLDTGRRGGPDPENSDRFLTR